MIEWLILPGAACGLVCMLFCLLYLVNLHFLESAAKRDLQEKLAVEMSKRAAVEARLEKHSEWLRGLMASIKEVE